MTAHAADEKFSLVVKSERKITNQILKMILEIEDNKFHLSLGHPSLFDWLTKRHGYDEGSANRRIQAARAMRAVPEVAEKLQEGKTTMTNLVKAQAIFRHQKNMTSEEKRGVIESIEGQTTEQATRTLFEMFPEAASQINQDRKTTIDANHVRLAQNFTNEEDALFERVKELTSHSMPNATRSEVMVYLAKYFTKCEDPLVKVPRKSKVGKDNSNSKAATLESRIESAEMSATSSDETLKTSAAEKFNDEPETKNPNPKCTKAECSTAVASKQRVKRADRIRVIQKAGRQCEFVDELTGQRCSSRIQPEVDHIKMRAHGGSNDRENLRCCCRSHNLYLSEQKLGKDRANRWRNQQ